MKASSLFCFALPNPRGSGGWGQKFRAANLKDFGGADYDDIQDGVDELIARRIADRDHMGVMGWSYGGYMTAWTITQTSRFRAASLGAAMTNLYSMYGTTNFPFFFEWYFGSPPWQARERYVAQAPIRHPQDLGCLTPQNLSADCSQNYFLYLHSPLQSTGWIKSHRWSSLDATLSLALPLDRTLHLLRPPDTSLAYHNDENRACFPPLRGVYHPGTAQGKWGSNPRAGQLTEP